MYYRLPANFRGKYSPASRISHAIDCSPDTITKANSDWVTGQQDSASSDDSSDCNWDCKAYPHVGTPASAMLTTQVCAILRYSSKNKIGNRHPNLHSPIPQGTYGTCQQCYGSCESTVTACIIEWRMSMFPAPMGSMRMPKMNWRPSLSMAKPADANLGDRCRSA